MRQELTAHISSRVEGTKNSHAIILQYKGKHHKKFQTVLGTYGLTDTAELHNADSTYLVCPQALQKPRVDKIMRASKADNLKEYERTGRATMPLQGTTLTNTIHSQRKARLSRKHYNLLQALGAQLNPPACLVGSSKALLNVARARVW